MTPSKETKYFTDNLEYAKKHKVELFDNQEIFEILLSVPVIKDKQVFYKKFNQLVDYTQDLKQEFFKHSGIVKDISNTAFENNDIGYSIGSFLKFSDIKVKINKKTQKQILHFKEVKKQIIDFSKSNSEKNIDTRKIKVGMPDSEKYPNTTKIHEENMVPITAFLFDDIEDLDLLLPIGECLIEEC